MIDVPERIIPGTKSWDLFHYEHMQRYKFALPYCLGKKVLDVACGVGYGSHYLATNGANSVTGIDISPDAIDFAKQHYTAPNLEFIQQDAQTLELPNQLFDIVVSFETIEHLENPEIFVERVHRVLRPGGLFICSSPNKDFYPKGRGNPYHLQEFSLSELVSLLETHHFKVTEMFTQTHSISYLRYQDLIKRTNSLWKVVRHSWVLRFENAMRRIFKRTSWDPNPNIPLHLIAFEEGDIIIRKIEKSDNKMLTLILIGSHID